MLEELKAKIEERFFYTKEKDEQICHLYDFIMKYFKIDGLEGENVTRLIMNKLIQDDFMIYKPYFGMNGADKFSLKKKVIPAPKIIEEPKEESSGNDMGVFGLPESMGGGIGFF
jgi:hypothetical protein